MRRNLRNSPPKTQPGVWRWRLSSAVGVVMVLDPGGGCVDRVEGEGVVRDGMDTPEPDHKPDKTRTRSRTSSINKRETTSHNGPHPNTWADPERGESAGVGPSRAGHTGAGPAGAGPRPELRRPLSLEVKPARWRGAEPEVRRVQQPPWRSGRAPCPPARSLTSPGFMRRSESICAMNGGVGGGAGRGRMRPATSLPHIARVGGATPLASPSASTPRGSCLLVALRPINMEQERQAFFQSDFQHEPQFQYTTPEPSAVLDKYREGSDLFLTQAVGIMECVLRKFGSYESFEEATGGPLLPKSRVWGSGTQVPAEGGLCGRGGGVSVGGAAVPGGDDGRKLSADSDHKPVWCAAALAGGHAAARDRYALPARALLYYTVYHAAHMSFSQLFSHISHFVQDPAVRWEYCIPCQTRPDRHVTAQVSRTHTSLADPSTSRDIDFKMLASLGKVSYEDVECLRHQAVLHKTRIPHFMQDQERYLQQLDHIIAVNELDDSQLRELIP
ncbi:hypothetical protein SKAU_G00312290 [Synaphobranchus kaupii]|uniref:Uncharacterized protein n=1 Tax=Synaphobranchus kaupii TaxID=118154 RepID=A0A9Q1ILG9_SYNKA|nr:hypothetical protein SKAU_G00312290 [Synaphobranchus kaupii]